MNRNEPDNPGCFLPLLLILGLGVVVLNELHLKWKESNEKEKTRSVSN